MENLPFYHKKIVELQKDYKEIVMNELYDLEHNLIYDNNKFGVHHEANVTKLYILNRYLKDRDERDYDFIVENILEEEE